MPKRRLTAGSGRYLQPDPLLTDPALLGIGQETDHGSLLARASEYGISDGDGLLRGLRAVEGRRSSAYGYAGNNPLLHTDPTGLSENDLADRICAEATADLCLTPKLAECDKKECDQSKRRLCWITVWAQCTAKFRVCQQMLGGIGGSSGGGGG
jgi:hypothetical protein